MAGGKVFEERLVLEVVRSLMHICILSWSLLAFHATSHVQAFG